jgi:hypothetical protein
MWVLFPYHVLLYQVNVSFIYTYRKCEGEVQDETYGLNLLFKKIPIGKVI